jgi:thiol-disulfide isomerase/thioredoxin
VTSEAQFDELIANAGSKLVVVDCGATWCGASGSRVVSVPKFTPASSLTPCAAGPCKLFKPIFAQFADAYHAQAQFVAITGDLNPSTASLMKRLNVKSVPAFFFYKDGKQVQAFTGANKQGFRNNLSEYITL